MPFPSLKYSVFQQFKAMVELQFDTKVETVQTVWRSEFRLLTQFFHTHGIIHQLICTHTHHQNGVVETRQNIDILLS